MKSDKDKNPFFDEEETGAGPECCSTNEVRLW